VTVIERNTTLLHREDPNVTAAVSELFRDEGIEVRTGTTVHRVEGQSGKSVRLHTSAGVIDGTDLLAAAGRTPNTDGLGLATAGVEVDGLAKIPMEQVLRTHTLFETRGFMKALVETEGGRILGFTALGVDAGEVMAAVQVAMAANLPYKVLRDMVLTHPTIAEGLGELFASLLAPPMAGL